MQSHRRNIHHMGGFRCDDLVGVTKPIQLRLGDFETVVRVRQQCANALAQQALGQTCVQRHLQIQAWQQHIDGLLFVNMQDSHQRCIVTIGNRGNDVHRVGNAGRPSAGGPGVIDQAKDVQGTIPVVTQGSCHCQTRLRIVQTTPTSQRHPKWFRFHLASSMSRVRSSFTKDKTSLRAMSSSMSNWSVKRSVKRATSEPFFIASTSTQPDELQAQITAVWVSNSMPHSPSVSGSRLMRLRSFKLTAGFKASSTLPSQTRRHHRWRSLSRLLGSTWWHRLCLFARFWQNPNQTRRPS